MTADWETVFTDAPAVTWQERALATEAELSDLRAKHARIVYAYAAMLSRFRSSPEDAPVAWAQAPREDVEGWHKTYRETTS